VAAGCEGVAAINTISCVMGVNLDTLRPEPAVEGHSTQGGYSYRAVKPIALAKVRTRPGQACGGPTAGAALQPTLLPWSRRMLLGCVWMDVKSCWVLCGSGWRFGLCYA
jgi:hypothetical protein